MKPISFVARDGAGNVDRGSVSASKNLTTIQAEAGSDYSFNLRQSDIVSYKRLGGNLEIALGDGRTILIEDFFNSAGEPVADLHVSSDTYISEVSFVEGANGELYGQYGVAQTWGKYGAADDLVFVEGAEVASAIGVDDDVSMLGAGLLTGLGGIGTAGAVVGGAAVIGAAGGGGGGPVVPSVDDTAVVIGGDDVTDEQEVVTVTGTAEAGSEVVVVIGDQTVTTVSGSNGQWEAVFEGETFPGDGEFETHVTITSEEGEAVELVGPAITIDLTPPEINMVDGVQSTGDLVDAVDYADGVDVSGTGEAGASLTVTIGEVTHETVVGEDGSWSVHFTTSEVAEGEYEAAVTIVSTDSFGNSTTTVETLVVDTINNVSFAGANSGSDSIVNAAEYGEGVTLTGTTAVGSTVVVTLDGVSHDATVDANGNWSVTYSTSEVAAGEYTGEVTVVATDVNGNVSDTSGTVQFDTLVRDYTINTTTGGSDGVISGEETAAGASFGGTVEPGSTVMVNFAGIDREATVDADGNWSVSFSGTEIPESNGETFVMTAVATDGAQNSSTLTQDVVVDNLAGSLTLSSAPIEGDNLVNHAEASDGVVVRGTSDPGNEIVVELGGATVTTTTDANGNWAANFSAGQIEAGTYTADIKATTTDAAGNTREVTGTVDIDTEVTNLGVSANNVTSDNVVNGDERDDGVTFTGTTEPGTQSVMVTIDGETRPATVTASGSWSVNFPASALPEGEDVYTLEVDVVDHAGNTASTTRDVTFDTFVNELTGGAVQEGAQAVYNAAEVADGIEVSGTVEAGSTVVVTFGGHDYTATVASNGDWEVDLPASAFAAESYSADLVITATDQAGNTDSSTQTIVIDADIPDAPMIDGYTRDHAGYGSVGVELSEAQETIYEVDGTSVTQVAGPNDSEVFRGADYYSLDPSVPDGSNLVIASEDAAGNVSSTYLVLDDPAGSDVDMSTVNSGLAGLEIESIDLTFAEDTNLTLSLDQIEAFAEQSDTLAIHGSSDDTVTITGAVKTDQTVTEGSETYDVYTAGDTTVMIDDDINVVI